MIHAKSLNMNSMKIPKDPNTVEVIPGKLYWTSTSELPKDTTTTHYFNIDNELVYEPFFNDFGPLNLGKTYRYCRLLEKKVCRHFIYFYFVDE